MNKEIVKKVITLLGMEYGTLILQIVYAEGMKEGLKYKGGLHCQRLKK